MNEISLEAQDRGRGYCHVIFKWTYHPFYAPNDSIE